MEQCNAAGNSSGNPDTSWAGIIRKPPQIGDVIEIPTTRGHAYAQLTHVHPQFGELIRVFPGLYSRRPSDFGEVLAEGPRFSVFFPVAAAVRRSTMKVVAHEAIREELRSFPLFRAGALNAVLGRVNTWWLWDGEREWRVGELTDELRKLPIREAWNDTLLIQRIEQDWSPEQSD